MAHFAKLDQDNVVLEIHAVDNDILATPSGGENEAKGIAFLQGLFGPETRWAQTSYSGKIRKNYAGIGFQYDESRQAFIPPRPEGNYILDDNCQWIPTD